MASKSLNIADASARFQVMLTTDLSQVAVMTLQPAGQSSENLNTHPSSDQVVLVMEGQIEAEVAKEKLVLRQGDFTIIPAGTPHRLSNSSSWKAVTFNVYTPPEYPPGERD